MKRRPWLTFGLSVGAVAAMLVIMFLVTNSGQHKIDTTSPPRYPLPVLADQLGDPIGELVKSGTLMTPIPQRMPGDKSFVVTTSADLGIAAFTAIGNVPSVKYALLPMTGYAYSTADIIQCGAADKPPAWCPNEDRVVIGATYAASAPPATVIGAMTWAFAQAQAAVIKSAASNFPSASEQPKMATTFALCLAGSLVGVLDNTNVLWMYSTADIRLAILNAAGETNAGGDVVRAGFDHANAGYCIRTYLLPEAPTPTPKSPIPSGS